MLAKEIMNTEVISVTQDETVETVIKLLLEHNISGVPVIDKEEVVIGIVTEGDLIFKSKKLQIPTYFTILDSYIFLESTKNLEKDIKKMAAYKIKDIMTTEVFTVEEDATIEDVATLMTTKRVNRIPVTKDGRLTGIVSRRDIIKAYAQE
ncbi:CBS domain-containing protein [Serpentinicella sp. ANB-PHB4]|uniref:CBS domain-containing protein n=1 Tax=Serpentinicella sp. ANB-PHB4 TaxID=3074076 RepID=UPI0028663E60|nr:CBS domain-containing protein [Serpentinicella sp. ANB-PHB4]MDR5659335.1 CBS domain-containing protein [Serpentinicella sp. ANB-PHB4]